MGVKVEGSIPSFLKMLKQQMLVDSLFLIDFDDNSLNKFFTNNKNNQVQITGMSNYAASYRNREGEDVEEAGEISLSIFNLILTFGQMPLINSMNKKDAAFNLIPDRQSKYKLTLQNKIPYWYSNFIFFLLPLLHSNPILNNVNPNSKFVMFGMNHPFYGANLKFSFSSNPILSEFYASYYLLPLFDFDYTLEILFSEYMEKAVLIPQKFSIKSYKNGEKYFISYLNYLEWYKTNSSISTLISKSFINTHYNSDSAYYNSSDKKHLNYLEWLNSKPANKNINIKYSEWFLSLDNKKLDEWSDWSDWLYSLKPKFRKKIIS